jgi:hypothetical protein
MMTCSRNYRQATDRSSYVFKPQNEIQRYWMKYLSVTRIKDPDNFLEIGSCKVSGCSKSRGDNLTRISGES